VSTAEAAGAGIVGVEERFGPYGGRFVPEVLMAALDELSSAWPEARDDEGFRGELDLLLRDFVGRPTPLYLAERLSERVGRRVYLKREDLAHTGAHKINNAVGQALLARRMGKRRVIADTGAGQHGVAVATACALLGLECVVYMGTEDMRRQAPNVERMRLLGAAVAPVDAGARTLKEAVSAAIRDWVTNVRTTHFIIGSAVGPAPYPALVRDLQRVIGDEARVQALAAEDSLPARVIACVGGGSNAIGAFYAFLDDPVELIGVEAGGDGLDTGRHGAALVAGRTGVLHGSLSSVLADAEGQILEAHSVSAGLDYPGVGPEHAHLRDTGRARYESVTDADALRAFRELSRLEGIVPALEPAHAIAWLLQNGRPASHPAAPGRGSIMEMPEANAEGKISGAGAEEAAGIGIRAEAEHAAGIGSAAGGGSPAGIGSAEGFDLVCLSGRGDKDLAEATARLAEVDG
jgi:tryptophan synthase beta chain